MDRTLTIRLDRQQDEALTRRAKVLGKTRSAVVRELLDQALGAQPFGERAGHLKGAVKLSLPREGWRGSLRRRNWR